MNSESWIDGVLDALAAEELDRHLVTYPSAGGKIRIGDRHYLNFSSNDYLDFSNHPRIIASARDALERYGAGSTASRLVTGTLAIHDALEGRLASFKGYPAALLFGSGYMTNAGIVASVVGREDAIFADRLAHASILDAAVLSRSTLVRFQHNDVDHLNELLAKRESGRSLVITESVFSMDGDLAPLSAIAETAQRRGALLMVDEAHATGVFGPGGSGLIREHRLEPLVNVSMGTLSKAMGSYGGFVACSERLRELLINRARPFIYTTAPPPAAVGAALGALEMLTDHPRLPSILRENAALFRGLLKRAGLNTMQSDSQIVPVLVGENGKAMALSRRLRERGILAAAIRPPTVPEGTARLRFSITLAHSQIDLAEAANIVIAEARTERII